MSKRKTALFGGTFDPIHLGHTTVAAAASRHIGAEKTVFIPARHCPLKNFFPEANDEARFEMISLAISVNENFEVSDYELSKPEPSYTLDTIRKFRADYGGDTSIYWLAGADNVEDFPRWYRIVELIDECNLAVMYRAGSPAPDFDRFIPLWGIERVEKLRRNVIATPLIDISSTKIRNRLAAGRDADDMLAPDVADYIRKHGLYR